MTAIIRQGIIRYAKKLSDKELEEEYYKVVYESLGSETEEMYERGYDLRDIQERDEYERFVSEKADILERLCRLRGIRLWEEGGEG